MNKKYEKQIKFETYNKQQVTNEKLETVTYVKMFYNGIDISNKTNKRVTSLRPYNKDKTKDLLIRTEIEFNEKLLETCNIKQVVPLFKYKLIEFIKNYAKDSGKKYCRYKALDILKPKNKKTIEMLETMGWYNDASNKNEDHDMIISV